MWFLTKQKVLHDYKRQDSTGTNLKTRYNFLHFVPIQVEIALDEIAVNKTSNWLGLLISMK